jgi:hypothetical protein
MTAEVPIVGRYYRNGLGLVVQVEEVRPDGSWLGRIISHPWETGRANHRQWVPFWEPHFFTEVPPAATVGVLCRCASCRTKSPPSIVPIGVEA